MPEPIRTPKQSRVAAKSRSHPYARTPNGHHAHDVGVERSNSLLGALKNIVAAPLAWFSSGDPQKSNDIPQKKRVSMTERGGTPPKAKRVRRDSPELELVEDVGYLDPPPSLFAPKRPPTPLLNVANGVHPARTMSLDFPPLSIKPVDLPLSPSRGTSIMTHTSMSIEPQDLLPNHRQSLSRDVSMPPPSPFSRSFSRSTFTQHTSGATFGPSPKRRARESTAPPLLGSSTATPSFTRPPTSARPQNLFPRAMSRGRSEGPMSTLLAQSRQSVSPVRESPSQNMGMLVGDDVPVSRSQSMLKTERTLSALESFRTPLHSSQFPSSLPVENNRPRKVHVPIPSKLRFDHTPEGKKDKVKRIEVIGPYSSGMSGMRKLLARRREELEKEAHETNVAAQAQGSSGALNAESDVKEPQKNQAIETDTESVLESRQGRPDINGVSSNRVDLSPSGSPTRSKADSYSSLRAPSNKVHRSHASAPKLKKTRNKFSLDDDDDEQEWSMSVEELKSYQARTRPQTQTHISFSTTRRMSETGMQTDTSAEDVLPKRISSPVLPAQPQTFDSLLSRIGPATATTTKPVSEFPIEPPKTQSDATAQAHLTSASGSSSAPATLPFSFGMSSASASIPKPADVSSSPFAAPSTPAILPSAAPAAPAPGDGPIPSFFANTKVQFTPPTVPSGSLFGSPQPNGESGKGTELPLSVFGAAFPTNKEEKQEEDTSKEPKPFSFGVINKSSAFGGTSAPSFGNASLLSKTSTTSTTDVSSSPFSKVASGQANESSKESTVSFSFGTPGSTGTDTLSSGISIFGAATKPAATPFTPGSDTSTKPAFAFNTPPSSATPAPSMNKPKETASVAPSSVTASKPVFSFGTPASSSAEAPKSLFAFGSSTQPKASDTEAAKSPFSFGAAPSTPPPAEKAGFTFGVTAGTSAFSSGSGAMPQGAVNTLTATPPKPIFGGFGGAGTSVTPSTPKPAESTADNSDGMELAGDGMEDSPTRTVEKKDTPAIQLPQSSPFAAFGNTTGFPFGQNKTVPTQTPFSLGQSKPILGSGFSFGQNTDTSSTTATTGTGFSFGAANSTMKSTGQSSSLFGTPLTSAFGSAASNPTPPPSSFPFAQASTVTTANPFGQTPQQQENGTTTTPSSPSLFPQATSQSQSPSPSFSFNVPAVAASFGAAKPDTAAPSSTPSTQLFQFGGSSSSQQPQQQGSSAPVAGAVFNLGAAAATPPRKMRGLPTRRAKRS